MAYPQYTLEHVYRKSFKEGGLTLGQITRLIEVQMKAREEEIKFQIALHGGDPEDTGDKPERKSPKATQKSSGDDIFKGPDAYEHMTPEQRQQATDNMMGTLKSWVKGTAKGLGK